MIKVMILKPNITLSQCIAVPGDPFGSGPAEICNKARNYNSKDLNENAHVSFRQVALGTQLEYKWLVLPPGLKPRSAANLSGVTSRKTLFVHRLQPGPWRLLIKGCWLLCLFFCSLGNRNTELSPRWDPRHHFNFFSCLSHFTLGEASEWHVAVAPACEPGRAVSAPDSHGAPHESNACLVVCSLSCSTLMTSGSAEWLTFKAMYVMAPRVPRVLWFVYCGLNCSVRRLYNFPKK